MDCDDVMLFVAGSGTLTTAEADGLDDHLRACSGCRILVDERTPGRGAGRAVAAPPPGSQIGRFVVAEALGAGGMGVVVAAHDPDLDRRVAIKILHVQPGDRAASAGHERLIREARAMARLSHGNVLTVHEVGTFGDGVFIAMEFAGGGTLRSWLADHDRPWPQIVERFLEAGRGLAAAHRAGLVHRDFKPDNVVLTADGRVRVADFGLVSVNATALAESAADVGGPDGGPDGEDGAAPGSTAAGRAGPLPTLTATGSMMGTPAYMAPEQRRGDRIDARADQFAFCVALYEALYRARPFDERLLDRALGLHDRAIREPPAGAPVPRWIRDAVIRGLAAEPERRFPSMDALLVALAADPAAARRRRLAAAGLAIGGLAIGGLAIAALAITARGDQDDPCEAAARGLAGIWDDDRRREASRALRASARPHAGDVADRVAAGLDAYAAAWATARVESCRATHGLAEQSTVMFDLRIRCLDRRRSELAALIAVLAGDAGPEAVDHAVQAVDRLIPVAACADVDALAAAVPPPEDPQLRAEVDGARARLDHALALEHAGAYERGLAAAIEIDAAAERLGYAPLRAGARAAVARLLEATGKYPASETAHQEVLALAAEARDDALIAETWRRLIDVVGVRRARHQDALGYRRAAEAAVIRAGDAPRLRADLDHSLGALAWVRSDYAAAVEHYARALALREQRFGPDHLTVAATLSGLGPVLRARGELDEAARHYRRAIAIFEHALGPDHPQLAQPLDNLGVVLNAWGKHDEAERHHARALAIKEQALGPAHPRLADTLNNLGLVFKARGHYADAERSYRRALAIYEGSLGAGHARLASALNNLGFVVKQQGRLAEARAIYDRALAIDLDALGAEHPYVANTRHNLGLVLQAQGDHAAAQAELERALAIKERALGPDHASTANTLNNLGDALAARGALAEAQRRHERALAIWEAALGADHASVAFALTSLGTVMIERGRAGDAIAALERALQIRVRGGVARELIAATQAALGRALWLAARDRRRAIELATRARATYAAAGDARTSELARLDAWLQRVSRRAPAAR